MDPEWRNDRTGVQKEGIHAHPGDPLGSPKMWVGQAGPGAAA